MSLTFTEIWERYSHVQFNRRMYIKRLKEDGTYEADFTEISQGLMKDGSVQSLSRSLPNNSWQFGYVTVDNVGLEILSAFQEFASEKDPNSIFLGFIRHKSIIKIVDSFIDKYTDPSAPVEASVTTFQGFLDSTTATTEQGYETITALDFLSVLNDINVSQLTLTKTTMNELIYEIVNNPMFTKFFSVSNSSSYINAGFNATDIDVKQYTGSVFEMIEDLAKGHSIFYINPDDNYFYFTPVNPTSGIVYSFLEDNNRKLDISGYREGVDRQVTNWYWDGVEEWIQGDWTSVNWERAGSSNGWTHNTGNTTVLSESTLAVSGKRYKITYTVNDRTAGSFSISFGGYSVSSVTASGEAYFTSTSTGNLQITPTSNFDGSVDVSIKADISSVADPDQINPISQNFKIDGIVNDDQRQQLLDYVLSITKLPKPYFKLELPYFPVIKILDKIEVQSFGAAPPDAVRWGMFIWTSGSTTSPSTAPRWRKPAGIRISRDDKWMVRSISHDNNLRTTLELEKIL